MRDFFSESNLAKASSLAAVVTTMSVGRLAAGYQSLGLMITATFLLALFVCGAVTAWGRCADMPGIATKRSVLLKGIAVAAVVSLLAMPLRYFWLDPILRRSLETARNSSLLEMQFPSTTTGRISLVLWTSGFQLMFLVAAPLSLFARLVNRRVVAIALCIALRSYIASRQAAIGGISEGGAFFVLAAVTATAAECLVFTRFGLVPTMLLAAGLDTHVFFPAR